MTPNARTIQAPVAEAMPTGRTSAVNGLGAIGAGRGGYRGAVRDQGKRLSRAAAAPRRLAQTDETVSQASVERRDGGCTIHGQRWEVDRRWAHDAPSVQERWRRRRRKRVVGGHVQGASTSAEGRATMAAGSAAQAGWLAGEGAAGEGAGGV